MLKALMVILIALPLFAQPVEEEPDPGGGGGGGGGSCYECQSRGENLVRCASLGSHMSYCDSNPMSCGWYYRTCVVRDGGVAGAPYQYCETSGSCGITYFFSRTPEVDNDESDLRSPLKNLQISYTLTMLLGVDEMSRWVDETAIRTLGMPPDERELTIARLNYARLQEVQLMKLGVPRDKLAVIPIPAKENAK